MHETAFNTSLLSNVCSCGERREVDVFPLLPQAELVANPGYCPDIKIILSYLLLQKLPCPCELTPSHAFAFRSLYLLSSAFVSSVFLCQHRGRFFSDGVNSVGVLLSALVLFRPCLPHHRWFSAVVYTYIFVC